MTNDFANCDVFPLPEGYRPVGPIRCEFRDAKRQLI